MSRGLKSLTLHYLAKTFAKVRRAKIFRNFFFSRACFFRIFARRIFCEAVDARRPDCKGFYAKMKNVRAGVDLSANNYSLAL